MPWVSALDVASTVILIASVALGIALAVFVDGALLVTVVGIGVALSIAAGIANYHVFYNHVNCPRCKGNLNRYKNGKNVPTKQAYSQLANGYGCRHCDWKPNYAQDA